MFNILKNKTKRALAKVGALVEASMEIIGELVGDIPDIDFD